jgi:hypothetical protein
MTCPKSLTPLAADAAFFKKAGSDFAVLDLGAEDLRMKLDAGEERLRTAPLVC